MPVKAPFRFARINRWIHEPAWGPLVSHDVPFADGLSGRVTLRITAKTPLLVGGRRRPATENREGAVWPFRLPDGRWALPPSTLQGMTRAILEVAAFGRLGPWIEDRRFGIRDLAKSATADLHYRSRLTRNIDAVFHPQTRAGWLIKHGDTAVLVPCNLSRVHVDALAELRTALLAERGLKVGTLYNLRRGHKDPRERYNLLTNGLEPHEILEQDFWIEPQRDHSHDNPPRNIFDSECLPCALRPGARPEFEVERQRGTIVLTGKVPSAAQENTSTRNAEIHGKKREFVFFGPSRAELEAEIEQHGVDALFEEAGRRVLDIDQITWAAFLFLHCDARKRPKNETWTYWHDDFQNHRPVPVFWWPDAADYTVVSTFGMAFAFKAAFPLSTHDLLRHSHPDHLEIPAKAGLDLPHLVFGCFAEADQGRGLKRRAWFGLAATDFDTIRQEDEVEVILASPKPSYLGLYVRQRNSARNTIPADEPMAAFTRLRKGEAGVPATPSMALLKPELAGVKLWPAAANRPIAKAQAEAHGMKGPGKSVQTRLTALRAGAEFETNLTFHNLRPVEIGALLWALSFGDKRAFDPARRSDHDRLRHRLGMGKPFGLGEIQIDIGKISFQDGATRTPTDLICQFADHMAEAYRHAEPWQGKDPGEDAWRMSPQVAGLLKAASPGANNAADLAYMSLNAADHSYVAYKKAQAFLEPYVAEHMEIPRYVEPPEDCEPVHAPVAAAPDPVGVAPPGERIQAPAAHQIGAKPAPVRIRLVALARPELGIREGVLLDVDKTRKNPYLGRFGTRAVWLKRNQFEHLGSEGDPSP